MRREQTPRHSASTTLVALSVISLSISMAVVTLRSAGVISVVAAGVLILGLVSGGAFILAANRNSKGSSAGES